MSEDYTGVYEQQYVYCPTCATKLERREIDDAKPLACPQCDFIFWNNPKPAASALIHKDGKILLIQRGTEPHKGDWVLPGGYMDIEETPQETIVREVKEETGLDFQIERILGAYRINDDPRGIVIDFIYAGLGTGEVRLESTMSDFVWASPDDLPNPIIYRHLDAIGDWHRILTFF